VPAGGLRFLPDRERALLAERDYVTYATAFGRAPGVTIIRSGEFVARRGDPAHEYLSLVLGTWTAGDAADALIDRVIEAVGGPGRPFTWTVWPSNTPSDLRTRLVARGFRDHGDGPLMWLELEDANLPDAPPDGLTIAPVRDAATLAAAGRAMMPGGGSSEEARRVFEAAYEALILGPDAPMTYFAGWLDGRIVASSALFTGTGLAGIYAVGTVEDQRGRGIGGAVTAEALREGRRRGLHSAALLSTELGFPVYKRLGFDVVGTVSFLGSPSDE
jgi:ribosomal protein S18 acetylase RimI-like enzyme